MRILAQQITLPLPTFAERAPGIEVPPSLERLVMRLLAKRPQERIQRADDVIKAIDGLADGEAAGSMAPAATAQSEEPLPAFALSTQVPGELPSPQAGQNASVPTASPSQARSKPHERPLTASVAVAASSISKGVSQSFDKISSMVDSRRRAMPEPIRSWLIRIPAGMLVVILIGLILLLLGNVGLWVHRAQTSRAAAAAASAKQKTAALSHNVSSVSAETANAQIPVTGNEE